MERAIPLARLLAVPLLAVTVWVTAFEQGWYRVFPVVVMVFAVVAGAGVCVDGVEGRESRVRVHAHRTLCDHGTWCAEAHPTLAAVR